jgi:hypothetical protein
MNEQTQTLIANSRLAFVQGKYQEKYLQVQRLNMQ